MNPVPTNVAATNNGAKSAVSKENKRGKDAPMPVSIIPIVVGKNGPSVSIHFPIRTEINIGMIENKDNMTPMVNVDAPLSIA